MRVLVDTSVWSQVYRRRLPDSRTLRQIERLVEQERAVLIGAVRQEVLSGIRDAGQFRRLRQRLRAFPTVATKRRDYERAAEFFNRCAGRGVQGSNTDFLICAIAVRRKLLIYTTDADFRRFAALAPIRLFDPRAK